MEEENTDAAGGAVMEIDVRWGDMDALGHVNNTVYFRYCESARVAYFETLGRGGVELGAGEGISLAAASLNFRREMRYPGRVRVETRATAIGRSSFTLGYVLRNAADGAVVADGTSVVVWVDYGAGKPAPIPDAVVDAIVALERNPALRERRGGASAEAKR